jgi:hypothetical protein
VWGLADEALGVGQAGGQDVGCGVQAEAWGREWDRRSAMVILALMLMPVNL